MWQLFIVGALMLFSSCNSSCLYPWDQPTKGSKCYAISDNQVSYFDASEVSSTKDYIYHDLVHVSFCKTLGGYLAEPRSDEDTAIINEYIFPEFNYWIGLADLEEEGTFRWGTDFSTPEYTNWYPGQPSGGNVENCVLLLNSWGSNLWDDFRCAAIVQKHALCEKHKDS